MMPPLAGWTIWITGFVGKVHPIDNIMSLLVNDFFLPVIISLTLLALWLVYTDRARREQMQKTIMRASVGIGFTSLAIQLINRVHVWPRPFLVSDDAIRESARRAAEIVFYMPHDPSFPSNAAAISFAAATGVFLGNRKAGLVLYGLATLFSFARFYAGVHFFVDIAAGAALGSFISYLVFKYFMPRTEPLPTIFLKIGRFLYIA